MNVQILFIYLAEYDEEQRTSIVMIETCNPTLDVPLDSDMQIFQPDDMLQEQNTKAEEAATEELVVPEFGDETMSDANFENTDQGESTVPLTNIEIEYVIDPPPNLSEETTAKKVSVGDDGKEVNGIPKQPNLRDLTSHLAKVTHCQGMDDADILNKVNYIV